MDTVTSIKPITLFFDTFSTESKNLFESFRIAGVDFQAVVIEDDGFLPDGIISPYGFFMGDYSHAENIPGKPLYFNQVKVPKNWEICASGTSGKVKNYNREKARLFFENSSNNTRLIKMVDWLDDNNVVRLTEHYNKYGAIFCRTTFNNKGQKVKRSFYSPEGQEIIYENFVTKDIVVNVNGKDYIMNGKTAFLKFFFEFAGLDKTKVYYNSLSFPFFVSQSMEQNGFEDILFWNEPVGDEIPGNMMIILNNQATRTKKIFVQRNEAYERLKELGAPSDMISPLGYIYDFARDNNHNKDVLICTNTDNIEHFEEVIKSIPELHFHIAALTEMSMKLTAVETYENVSLYPNVRLSVLDRLFEKCDIYLDINHEGEIVDAVHRAFLNNQLILGFEETLHNRSYISNTNVFKIEEANYMIKALQTIVSNDELIDSALAEQRKAALAAEQKDYDIFK